jgi:hypothetical protein
MKKLTDFVIDMADHCVDVPQWLEEHMDFEPAHLLDAAAVLAKEEEGTQTEETKE